MRDKSFLTLIKFPEPEPEPEVKLQKMIKANLTTDGYVIIYGTSEKTMALNLSPNEYAVLKVLFCVPENFMLPLDLMELN